MKHSLTVIVLLGAALAGAVAADQGKDSKSRTVFRTELLKRGPIKGAVQAMGTLEPEEVVDVSAQVTGQVAAIGRDPRNPDKLIDSSVHVDKGTVLAQLDPSLYEVRVQQARANLRRAQAELKLAQIAMAQAERVMKTERDRFDSAQAAVEVCKAVVEQAEAGLREAEVNLGYCTIRSPIAGVVIDRHVNLGQTVSNSLSTPSLFLIAKDLKKLQVWASVAEMDVGQIRQGQAAQFTVDALRRESFRGKVEKVRLNAELTRGSAFYTVVIGVDNPDGKLIPYMSAQVDVFLGERKNVLRAPSAALRWRPQPGQVAPQVQDADAAKHLLGQATAAAADPQHVLWIEDEGHVRPMPVRVGLTDGSWTEVEGPGVNEGKPVVVGVTRDEAPTSRRPARPPSDPSSSQEDPAMEGLIIKPAKPSKPGVVQPDGKGNTLNFVDAVAIENECPAVGPLAPVIRARVEASYGKQRWIPLYVYGTSPEYLDIRDWQDLQEGRPFTPREEHTVSPVCLIGQTVARRLFGAESPVGKKLRLGNVTLKVVGVLQRKGADEMGFDQDDILLVPWTIVTFRMSAANPGEPSAKEAKEPANSSKQPRLSPLEREDLPERLEKVALDQILVRARSEPDVTAAARQITALLRDRHKIHSKEPDDFEIRDERALLWFQDSWRVKKP